MEHSRTYIFVSIPCNLPRTEISVLSFENEIIVHPLFAAL